MTAELYFDHIDGIITLQISEIKRINGIISDQEFYACTALKIPVRSHQHILQQELEQIAQERNSAPADQLVRSSAHASDVVSSVSQLDRYLTLHRVSLNRDKSGFSKARSSLKPLSSESEFIRFGIPRRCRVFPCP